MQIKKAEFVRSFKHIRDYFNEDTPEIAIVGRSNVGKSTLINMLTNNKKLARTSGQPGKTRLINYFLLNDEFYLVDLPGYGYARVSKAEQAGWGDMMADFLHGSPNLKAVMLLLDIRHKPTKDDIAMLHFIEYYAVPYFVVATKADKIAKTKRHAECARLRKELPTSFDYNIIPTSAQNGFGKDALLQEMQRFLTEETKETEEEA